MGLLAGGGLPRKKRLNRLPSSDQDGAFAAELPAFVEEIKRIFEPAEIRAYLEGVHQVGALGHVCTDDAYDEMRDAGAIPEDPVEWARQIIRLERTKTLLLS
ncbi:MAG: hypothetical protein ACRELA_10795 [Candidatus Rokuibacteriota bacterium]